MSESSVIGPSTTLRGNVSGQGSLEIFGRVEGDVLVTGDVTIAGSGAVRGNIDARTIQVAGVVQGNLRGSEAVLLERGAKVVGDLSAPRVGVASGALIRGNVRTEGEQSLGGTRRAAAPAGQRPAPLPVRPAIKLEPKPPVRAEQPKAPARVEPKPVPVAAVAVAAPAPIPAKLGAVAKSDPQASLPLRVVAREKDERRPPPPVLPSLGKGAKGKKKSRDSD